MRIQFEKKKQSSLSNKCTRWRKRILLLHLVFIFSNSFGQGVSNLWLYGYNNAGINGTIDFYNGLPTITTNQRHMRFDLEEAVISDNLGNLLFYTNGNYIADATDDTMLNGSNLTPGWFADSYGSGGFPMGQGAIIIPFPNDANKYYLFHEDGVVLSTPVNCVQPVNLFCSIVDMTLNNGLGSVVSKNVSILSDTLILGELTAVKHANGRDWWLICHKNFSDKFYMILITKYGIGNIYSQNIGFSYGYGGEGQNVFSPNGEKYARYKPPDGLDVMDFDRCTGQFSNWNHIQINDSASGGGVAFSSNSRYLYVGSGRYIVSLR